MQTPELKLSHLKLVILIETGKKKDDKIYTIKYFTDQTA